MISAKIPKPPPLSSKLLDDLEIYNNGSKKCKMNKCNHKKCKKGKDNNYLLEFMLLNNLYNHMNEFNNYEKKIIIENEKRMTK